MTALVQQQKNPLDQFKADLASNARHLAASLKADKEEQVRFMAEVYQAVRANPKLLDVDRTTLLVAIGEAAALGLSVNPNLGECYIIPRNRSYKGPNGWDKAYEANFQVGYKGLIKLAYRSEQIDRIYPEVVYRGEHYLRRGGTDPMIEHIPDDVDGLRTGKAEDIVAAYAVVWLKGSSAPTFRAISRAEIERTARSSGDPRDDKPSDVWNKHPEAMARKTAIIRIASVLPRDDKLRSFHEAAERDGVVEAGKVPPSRPELEGIRVSAPAPNSLEAMMASTKPAPAEPRAMEVGPPGDEEFDAEYDGD